MTDDGNGEAYVYDALNRLISANAMSVSLGYDASERLYEIAATGARRFLYDGDDLIAEYDAGGTLLRRYVHGPGVDNPIVCYDGGHLSGTGGATQRCLPNTSGAEKV